ncbi:Ctf8-domain-containing protein [Chaetomium strumarium]|uniref:Ctf8-domain-containing protein n=1 Tax=Chaetomium strumarium TaxID=1170767 RepID=A0AAJ0M0D8_9PEZI|nr:Ctf8-domain-containing protein [Chaetomium strumarium]
MSEAATQTVVPLHPPSSSPSSSSPFANPLPALLHTPSGLALLELQGTINLPPSVLHEPSSESDDASEAPPVPIGRLHFPEYHPGTKDDTAWMKRVWMYVGNHQRMLGEVKKLPRALAVLRRRSDPRVVEGEGEKKEEELEVVEVVKYKIVFSSRPEPVGGGVS